MIKFDDFEFVKEYSTMLADKHPLRLYRSRFNPNDLSKPIQEYRWHFGFPKTILPEPMLMLLETSPYWGEQHWKEEDGFYIYWLHDVSEKDEGIPKKLNKTLEFYLRSYNQVLNFYKRAVSKQGDKS